MRKEMNPNKRYLSRNLVTPPFHDKQLLRDIWGEAWGVSDCVGTVRKVVMHRPGQEILQLHGSAQSIESGPELTQSIVGATPQSSQGAALPDLAMLQSQFDGLQETLRREGIEIIEMEGGAADEWPERLFTRDLGLMIPGGIILSRLALYIRYGETRLMAQTCANLGIPILGTVQGTGFMEGGSFAMLDRYTAVVGRSERVNAEGIEQLRHLLSLQHIELIAIDLPATIIHLDEAFLMLDYGKALVQTALLPFWFLEELRKRRIGLIHVDPQDPQLTINALTVAPGRVVICSSGVRTIELLRQQGVTVLPVQVDELFKLGGGIHCVTLPLIRD